MSEELEHVHTINLGKVLLSQSQHRSVRALNMIREFARRHMKTQTIKIDEDLARQIWARGARSPPRKIRVRMNRNDLGQILVSLYEGPLEAESATEDKTPKVEDETTTTTTAAMATTADSIDGTPSLPEPVVGGDDSDSDKDELGGGNDDAQIIDSTTATESDNTKVIASDESTVKLDTDNATGTTPSSDSDADVNIATSVDSELSVPDTKNDNNVAATAVDDTGNDDDNTVDDTDNDGDDDNSDNTTNNKSSAQS